MRIGDREYNIDDNLEIVKPVNSEITILDLKPFIDSLCPIKIFIDGQVAWDDDSDDIDSLFKKYDDITTQKTIVATVSIEIVSYHHSIIKITTA